MRPGDEILSVDGRDVEGLGPETARKPLRLNRLESGTTVALELQRDGSSSRVTLEAAGAQLQLRF